MASKREHELRQAAAAGAVRRSEREKSDASWYSWYSLAECGTNPRPGSPPRLSIRRQLQPPALPLPARAACAAMQAALCCFQERTWHSRQQQGDFKGYSAGVWIFQHTGVHDPQRFRRRCGGGWAQLAPASQTSTLRACSKTPGGSQSTAAARLPQPSHTCR